MVEVTFEDYETERGFEVKWSDEFLEGEEAVGRYVSRNSLGGEENAQNGP